MHPPADGNRVTEMSGYIHLFLAKVMLGKRLDKIRLDH